MPELNGADSLTFFVVPQGLVQQVRTWREGLASAPQVDEFECGKTYDAVHRFFGEVSLRQVEHGLTIFPGRVTPGYEAYAKLYNLREEPAAEASDAAQELQEFDPSGAQEVLYKDLVELCSFPLVAVNLFAQVERDALVVEYEALLKMEMDRAEAESVAKVIRVLRGVRPGELVAMLYFQWTP